MLLYAAICCYMLLYAAICCYMLGYILLYARLYARLLYTAIYCYMLLYTRLLGAVCYAASRLRWFFPSLLF